MQAWGSPPDKPADIYNEVECFREAMSNICDVAMPRVRPGCIRRRQLYWWSPELESLQIACVATRRRKSRIRRPGAVVIEVELYEGFGEARRTVRAEMVKMKNEAYSGVSGEARPGSPRPLPAG